jgi:hypothetical protein
MRIAAGLLAICIACFSVSAFAGQDPIEAVQRTNADNYKDRALASCLAAAYKDAQAGQYASQDARVTASAFGEWTYYNLRPGNADVDWLIQRYLRRDYSNPVEGYAGAQFELLKCLDMYHSPTLEELVHKHVPHPTWIGDQPKRSRAK